MDKREMTPSEVADYLARIRAEAPRAQRKPKTGRKPKKGHKRPRKTVPRPEPPENPHELVEVILQARHNINGVLYGPGYIQVPRGVVPTLMEQESRAVIYDATWKQEKAVIIGPREALRGHKALRVDPSVFEAPDLRAPEAATATGGEASSLQPVTGAEGELVGYEWQGG